MIALGDGLRLRRATATDLDAILTIKRALPMPAASETRRGGFLLDSDRDAYRELLTLARAWLLEQAGEAVGFTIALDDAALRASPVWARGQTIEWRPSFDPAALDRRLAYFDQIAVLPRVRARYWGAALALRALAELIEDQGHALVLTTTVLEPIVNHAALPYLARVGAREVGRLAQTYPGVGPVVSAIHAIEAERYREHIQALADARRPATLRLISAIS